MEQVVDRCAGIDVGQAEVVVCVRVPDRVTGLPAELLETFGSMLGCGVPGNGFLKRATCTWMFPGPVNVPDEATYWMTQWTRLVGR